MMATLSNRDYAHFLFEDYDVDAQLLAIRAALATSRRAEQEQSAEIDTIAQLAQETDGARIEDQWVDALHGSVYDDAARSAAAIGMLAPFVENLFTGIFRGMAKLDEAKLALTGESDRAKRARQIYWDPHVHFQKHEQKADLVSGIIQLAEAEGLTTNLPGDLKPVLEALFSYRNEMLHNGFEWPAERRTKFAARVGNWPKRWFACSRFGGQPWVWYMTDEFIDRVLSLVEETMEAAGAEARTRQGHSV